MLIASAFKRLHYPIDVITQCVRWYLAYSLSLRNLEEMMAELGIDVDHSTLHRWVLRVTPVFNKIAAKYKNPVTQSWHIDETYIKIKGKWHYLYRAIDSNSKTVDFLLTKRRDMQAARRFFKNAISKHACPIKVTIDRSAANKKAVESLNTGFTRLKPITIRQNKYMNNRIEQDHRFIKKRVRSMLGFKSFRSAKIILLGIELMHMIRKEQFNLSKEFQNTLGLFCLKFR
ncbi:IS6 family transposase [Acinetobacter faecalis]|uniref:IS6 family transposase n=1 Tax=Acinetobacter faecalis TaxID=2665161 RepID=UPI002A908703|nr:IS6 family transposase [Acinetobacter faecalis]MDY6483211.1 IS6 family transposase [Acinetobacter faecalis]